MIRRLLLLTLASLALVAVPLAAHEGHEHKILGTVTVAAADRVTVKDRAGKTFTIDIVETTKVLKDKKPATVADIKSGMRVVVTAITEKKDKVERMRAKQIDLGIVSAQK